MVDTEYIEPTCTAKGRRCSKCKVCGQIFFDYTADELGHDWATDFTIDKEATCFKDGSKSIHCNREGCTARKDVTVIKALGKHVWRETTIEPTCTEDGKNIIYCENCDKKTETVIEALGHSFKNYVYDGNATCEKDGTETAKCENKNCNEKDTHIKYGTKTGHTLPEGDGVIIKQPSQCAIPGLSKKICMTCGKAIYTEIPGPGHTWKEELKKFTNECTGYTEYRECSKCGMLDVVGRSTKEGGHIWDSEDYVTAKCSVCGMKAPNYTNKWAAENPNSKERIRAVWYVMYKTNLEQSEAFENNKNLDCDSVIDAEVEFDREAPAPKKGFRFIGWYNDGKEVTKKTVLHTTWKDFQKVFEARYERIEN